MLSTSGDGMMTATSPCRSIRKDSLWSDSDIMARSRVRRWDGQSKNPRLPCLVAESSAKRPERQEISSAPQPRKSSGFTQEPCYFCATASPVQTSDLRKGWPGIALGTSRCRDRVSPAPIWMLFFALPGLVNKLLKHSCQGFNMRNGVNSFASSSFRQVTSSADRPRAATELRRKRRNRSCRRDFG